MENIKENKSSFKLDKTNILFILVSIFILISLVNSYFIFSKNNNLINGNTIANNSQTNLNNIKINNTTTPSVTPINSVVKSAKPKIELFVMSHCPYGTQIEKGIIPVVELLKDKIDFQIKFVSYAMHGEKEIKEQLNQYCIEKEQSEKFITYLKCFLNSSDGNNCIIKASIDQSKLNACVNKADLEFKIIENFANQSTWLNGRFPKFDIYTKENVKYGVKGSPSLVINGIITPSARDSASLLKTICAAFNTVPDECSKILDSSNPSAGFGYNVAATVNPSTGCGG